MQPLRSDLYSKVEAEGSAKDGRSDQDKPGQRVISIGDAIASPGVYILEPCDPDDRRLAPGVGVLCARIFRGRGERASDRRGGGAGLKSICT